MPFAPVSVYENYWVGVDGEGIGNDYVLLDSSLDDYPRLYTGKRLTTRECLDWAWGLAHHAGYCKFALFGASYDFNNWLRDIPVEDVKRLANSQMVRYQDYLILWQARFKFEIRKIKSEDTTKPEYSAERYQYWRIHTRLGDDRVDYIGVIFEDVQPWWQCSFVKALDMTLKERAIEHNLIVEGKDARGTFTHDRIEWVSKYNKAECRNLAWMMVELDKWLYDAHIKPLHYNGPGAAAKALLRTHAPYMHAGRRIHHRSRSLSQRIQEYVFPGADSDHSMLQRTLSAYAGALNKQLQIGYYPATAHQYDIVSAYPFCLRNLPCLSHGHWERTREFDPKSFGLWKISYHATKLMRCYPFFWRTPDGSIEYPFAFEERWAHTAEIVTGLAVDAEGIQIHDGWKWIPDTCDNPYPFWWITPAFKQRQRYKAEGNEGAANGLKLPFNSLYGSIAQARGGTPGRPPWSQQLLWAGAITAFTRARLYLAYCLNPEAIVHMATDGIISLEPLRLNVGTDLGQWEHTELTNLTVVQYGVYAAESCTCGKHPGRPWHHRERGFVLKDEEVAPFVARIHDMWRQKQWVSMEVQQHLFVTCGLVAINEKRYDEWCTWQDISKQIELDSASIFKMGSVDGVPGMWPIQDASYNLKNLNKSKAYEPKWGKGEDFPREWKQEDAYEHALEIEA